VDETDMCSGLLLLKIFRVPYSFRKVNRNWRWTVFIM